MSKDREDIPLTNPVLSSGIGNWRTTLGGTAVASTAYLTNVGYKLPDSASDWGNLLFSLLIQFVFMLAKDAAVGSGPE